MSGAVNIAPDTCLYREVTGLKTETALDRNSLQNYGTVRGAYSTSDIMRMNARVRKSAGLDADAARETLPVQAPVQESRRAPDPAAEPRSQPAPTRFSVPPLSRTVGKGQKTSLFQAGEIPLLRVGFGWNVRSAACDVDASAFLLGPDRKVPGDDWFVFYGQTASPDGSVTFSTGGTDREVISVDFTRLRKDIERIVFVMTIDEAFSRRQHFGLIEDAYMRVLDGRDGRELASYKVEDAYETVTSMTLGEIYLHNGVWRLNPVGNGVHQDLAGQCALYGVAIA